MKTVLTALILLVLAATQVRAESNDQSSEPPRKEASAGIALPRLPDIVPD
jgi:hypothetical protein